MSDLQRIDPAEFGLSSAGDETLSVASLGGISPIGQIPPSEECADRACWYQGAEQLRSLDGDEDFVRAVAARFGVELKARSFPCVLPGHDGAAAFWRDRRGLYVYRDFHSTRRGAYSLAQAYASIVAGLVRAPRGASQARWKLRLAVDVGWVGLPGSRLRPLPADAPGCVASVYSIVDHLLRVRALGESAGPEPSPLSAQFLLDWAGNPPGLSVGVIERAKRWMEAHDVLVRAYAAPAKFGRTTYWLPGSAR